VKRTQKLRLYKYCGAAKWALQAIENHTLKVATDKDINDPFEILPVALKKKDQRKYVRKLRQLFFQKAGVISFTANWHHPLMWSHYGDNHRGLCLGFDVPAGLVLKVDYIRERPIPKERVLPDGSVELQLPSINTFAQTKSKHWDYEDEYRLLPNIEKQVRQNKFPIIYDLPEEISLREVIVGPLSTTSVSETVSKLRHPNEVDVFQSRLAFKKFKVVRQKNKKLWN